MIQKKICMIGSIAVGKTSLVEKFVRGIFSKKYLTTDGVKIDKKTLEIGLQRVRLILWDLNGADEYQGLQSAYLRGAAGYCLVADGTRPATLDLALNLRRTAVGTLGEIPFCLLLNKWDLRAEWALERDQMTCLGERWMVLKTSAKTGEGVEDAFRNLTQSILEASTEDR